MPPSIVYPPANTPGNTLPPLLPQTSSAVGSNAYPVIPGGPLVPAAFAPNYAGYTAINQSWYRALDPNLTDSRRYVVAEATAYPTTRPRSDNPAGSWVGSDPQPAGDPTNRSATNRNATSVVTPDNRPGG